MLSDKDVDKLLNVFSTKQEVEDIVGKKITPLQQLMQKTLLAVEGLASRFDKQELVNAARDTQQSRHDRWIHQIAAESQLRSKTEILHITSGMVQY